MNQLMNFSLIFLLSFSAVSYAGVFDAMKESLSGGDTSAQAVTGAGQAAGTVQAAPSGSLVDALVQQLGVTPAQAQGGAGALFQAAKSRMTDEAFSTVSESVPGMDQLLATAPQSGASSGLAGGLSSLAGDQAGSLGSLASLASSFQQLGLSSDMVTKFVPVMVDYVKQSGGEVAASLLSTALAGI